MTMLAITFRNRPGQLIPRQADEKCYNKVQRSRPKRMKLANSRPSVVQFAEEFSGED